MNTPQSSNLFTAITRAQQNAPLTPFERAFLKFLQGALIGIIIDGGNILLAYYANNGPGAVDWIHLLLIPLGTGFLAALLKWLSAQGDVPPVSILSQSPVPPPAYPVKEPAPTQPPTQP